MARAPKRAPKVAATIAMAQPAPVASPANPGAAEQGATLPPVVAVDEPASPVSAPTPVAMAQPAPVASPANPGAAEQGATLPPEGAVDEPASPVSAPTPAAMAQSAPVATPANPGAAGQGAMLPPVGAADQPASLVSQPQLTAPDMPIRHIYPVRSPLKHGGLRYRPDDPETCTIVLTEAEAEALQAIGVLGEPEEAA